MSEQVKTDKAGVLKNKCTSVAGWYYDQSTSESVVGELEWCYQRLCELGDKDTIEFINDTFDEHFNYG